MFSASYCSVCGGIILLNLDADDPAAPEHGPSVHGEAGEYGADPEGRSVHGPYEVSMAGGMISIIFSSSRFSAVSTAIFSFSSRDWRIFSAASDMLRT